SDVTPRRPEDRSEQLRRRRLAVRAGNPDEPRVLRQQAPRDLDLRVDGYAALPRDRDERSLAGHAGALDENVDSVEQFELELVAERAVDEYDVITLLVQTAGDGLAGAREPVHQRFHDG